LIDSESDALPSADIRAYWTTYDVPAEAFSIPALVEEQAEDLRREYLAWVNDFGNFRVGGRSVKSHLLLLPDFSFWWMTLIAEKEPLKSESIYIVFKLRVLENLCDRLKSTRIVYAGRNRDVHQTLSRWCRASQRQYEWIRAGLPRRPAGSWRRRLLPHPVQAVSYLAQRCLNRYRFAARARLDGPAAYPDEVTIVTYFPNVDMDRTRSGRFWSRYWERLHELLDNLPLTVNWLWIYAESGQCSFREALRLRDVCNSKDPGKYRHFVADEFMSPARVLRALWYYGFLCWQGLRLVGAKAGFRFAGSGLNFYPILRRDWRASLFGLIAMDGVLHCAALECATERLPARPWGMFVWENQPWELILMTAWRRRSPSGTMIAHQHTCLQFLDLRSFADVREYQQDGADGRPIPDVLVVNGSAAFDLMNESGFPAERLYVAEAIRFPGLRERPVERQRKRVRRTLLLATGLLPGETRFQIALVQRTARSVGLPDIGKVLIKPHPFCPVEPILSAEAVTFEYEVVERPLAELWPDVDVAFVANSTSVFLEAIYQGIPVAVCAPDDAMNLSPAFKRLPVPIIANPTQLADFLSSDAVAVPPGDYFVLGDDLRRWRTLLDSRPVG
jgi:surface carbohydrate biosynthesis protein (TIGR04326 family)